MAGFGWSNECSLLWLVSAADELPFKRAGGAFGELDRIFCAGFLAVHLEGELDEFVDELTKGNTASFPHFWIHADGSEARNGVHFVEINLAGLFFDKEIHAG